MKLIPVQGPDGRLYLNLSEVANLIEGSEPIIQGIPRSEREYWADVLRVFEARAMARIGIEP